MSQRHDREGRGAVAPPVVECHAKLHLKQCVEKISTNEVSPMGPHLEIALTKEVPLLGPTSNIRKIKVFKFIALKYNISPQNH
jgi:hypothetical protein